WELRRVLDDHERRRGETAQGPPEPIPQARGVDERGKAVRNRRQPAPPTEGGRDEAGDRDAGVGGNRGGGGRALETDEVDVDLVRGQSARVVAHARRAAKIGDGDDDRSHRRAESSQKRARRLAATRRRYSAVDRESSTGAISVWKMCWASCSEAP